MKKFLFISVMLIILCLNGCNKNETLNENSKYFYNVINDPGFIQQYASPYTAMYENEDGTADLYIFYSPTLYREDGLYKLIDNTLIEESFERFTNKGNNINVSIPKKLKENFIVSNDYEVSFNFVNYKDFSKGERVIFKNMYGDEVSAIKYQSKCAILYVYPSNIGIKFELHTKDNFEKDLKISVNGDYNCLNNGTVVFSQNGENIFVVQKPIIKDAYNNIKTEDIRLEDNNMLCIDIAGENVIDLSFDYSVESCPDAVINSDGSTPSYLSNIIELASNENSEYYVRSKFQWFFNTIREEDINKSCFNFYVLNDCTSEIDVSVVNEQWSSSMLTWSNRILNTQFLTRNNVSLSLNSIDITEYSKNCWRYDPYFENKGLVFQNVGDENVIFLSNDNSKYYPYIKISLKKRPIYSILNTQFISVD